MKNELLQLRGAILEKVKKFKEDRNYEDAEKWLLFHKFVEDFKPEKEKKTIEQRYTKFHDSCSEYVGEYPHQMVVDFVSYWTEHNEGGKKMRFEMAKNQPFNIKRRLATWKRNSKNFNNGSSENDRVSKFVNG